MNSISKHVVVFTIMTLTASLFSFPQTSEAWHTPVIIDHNCTDISMVPTHWIDSVKANCRLHYAHTSHGGQLTSGIDTLRGIDPFYAYALGYCSLPTTPGAFCIHEGQSSETYISPDLYWETDYGMNITRTVLSGNPAINFSMWCWCCQLD
ncbi:hypothetical protein JXI42_00475, partial [bacterium]|nr:hypothetical protein [bacterium]